MVSSFLVGPPISKLQKLCANIIKSGPLPKNIAFIADGNRRFARKNNISTLDVHDKTWQKLSTVYHWCETVGINQLTVFVLSTENLKRPKVEVDRFLGYAMVLFRELLDDSDVMKAEGLCIRALGDFSLLPPEFQRLTAKLMLATKDNDKTFLNLAISYNSRSEIAKSIQHVVEGARGGLIQAEDIDEELLTNCLFTNGIPDPDLLIRTGGDTRLSDFLLWQSSSSLLDFPKSLLPEFSFWDFLRSILKYQRCCGDLKQLQKDTQKQSTEANSRAQKFAEQIQMRRWEEVRRYADM